MFEDPTLETRKEADLIRRVFKAIGNVWYVTGQTYVFTTQTAVEGEKRVFVSQSDIEMYRRLVNKGKVLGPNQSENEIASSLEEIVRKGREDLLRENKELRQAISVLWPQHPV
ncbi:hypothetical protein TWF281_011464 [Arthrobotrys megalospora]